MAKLFPLIKINKTLWILFFISISLSSCKKSDQEKIIGKWENDQDWFEFFDNHTYNGGKAIITEVKGYKYDLSESDHQLTMYTQDESQSFYLNYSFIGNDSLALTNTLSKSKIPVIFVRVKKEN